SLWCVPSRTGFAIVSPVYIFFLCVMLCFFFFFFQAEDGIRDRNVTGVQTCALPICGKANGRRCGCAGVRTATPRPASWRSRQGRSEERRVGKECRSRWSP